MTTVSKKTGGKKIPKLRFLGFREEWDEEKIETLVREKIIYKPLDGNHGDIHPKTSDFVASGIPFVMSNDIKEGRVDLKNSYKITVKQANSLKKGFSIEGDVLLTHKGSVGLTAIVPKLNTEYVMLTPQVTYYRIFDLTKLVNTFLKYSFDSPSFQKEITIYSGGGTRPYIGITEQRKLIIKLPTVPEQNKIVDFLSTVDDWIENLKREKEQLEKYKKGMMQKLFSQKIRFKAEDEKDFPEWEEKKLGEVFDFMQSNSLSRSQLNYISGEVKNIHYGDIHSKYKSLFDIEKEQVPYVNNDVDVSKIKKDSFCQEGDVVVADASEDYKDIGKAIELMHLKNTQVVAGLHTLLLRRKPQANPAPGFINYFMQTPFYRKQVMKIAAGISVLGISKGNLSKVDLTLPSFSEQQKISDFLSSINVFIEDRAKQIKKAEKWKKGLMQQLFI